MRFVALRYFNAAGATVERGEDHEPESHLVPNVLFAVLGKRDYLSVFGDQYPTPDGTPVRDYVHVADLGQAHALLSARRRFFAVYKLGQRSGIFRVGSHRDCSARYGADH